MHGLENHSVRLFTRSILYLATAAVAFRGAPAQAKEKCRSEIKLLLEPAELHSALGAFHAERETASSVYFFDTNRLELLSEGVILRLRSGAASDITVKLRPLTNLETSSDVAGADGYKCETDITGEMALRSYSVRTKFAGKLPANGQELFELLTSEQKQLLAQVHLSLDWTRIHRIAEIKATDWEIKGQSPFPKLILERWQWPTGEILELSAKVGANSGPSAYAQLRQIALSNGLSLSAVQKPKTPLVLEDLSHARANSPAARRQ